MGATEARELTLYIENDADLHRQAYARNKSMAQLDREIADAVPSWRGGR